MKNNFKNVQDWVHNTQSKCRFCRWERCTDGEYINTAKRPVCYNDDNLMGEKKCLYKACPLVKR